MSPNLERKKIKRTGFIPTFMIGGLLAGAIPILNMAVRSDIYVGLAGTPLQILLDANWQMMAMLNILLIILGACMIYHTEYADNALQKMCTLPIAGGGLFLGKFVLMVTLCIAALAIEAAGIAFSSYHWFAFTGAVGTKLVQCFCYSLLLMLPAILASLLIAAVCKNMWISLGIGILCIFAATMMLPTDNFTLSLFPFALPFQTYISGTGSSVQTYVIAGAAESAVLAVAGLLIPRIRRSFE